MKKYNVFIFVWALMVFPSPLIASGLSPEAKDAVKAARIAARQLYQEQAAEVQIETIESGWKITFYITEGSGKMLITDTGGKIYRGREIIYLDKQYKVIKEETIFGAEKNKSLRDEEREIIFRRVTEILNTEQVQNYVSPCKREFEKLGAIKMVPMAIFDLVSHSDLISVGCQIVLNDGSLVFSYRRCGCGSVATWGCHVSIYLHRDTLDFVAISFY